MMHENFYIVVKPKEATPPPSPSTPTGILKKPTPSPRDLAGVYKSCKLMVDSILLGGGSSEHFLRFFSGDWFFSLLSADRLYCLDLLMFGDGAKFVIK
jgi:hypothetical protein